MARQRKGTCKKSNMIVSEKQHGFCMPAALHRPHQWSFFSHCTPPSSSCSGLTSAIQTLLILWPETCLSANPGELQKNLEPAAARCSRPQFYLSCGWRHQGIKRLDSLTAQQLFAQPARSIMPKVERPRGQQPRRKKPNFCEATQDRAAIKHKAGPPTPPL